MACGLVLFLPQCCPEPVKPDVSSRAPVESAPLFHDPADAAEADASAQVQQLLRSRDVAIMNSGSPSDERIFPPESAAAIAQILSPLPGPGSYGTLTSSPGGRLLFAVSSPPRIYIFEWDTPGQLTQTVYSEEPDEFRFCSYNGDPSYPTIEDTHVGTPRWLSEDRILFERFCNDVVFNLQTNSWSNAEDGDIPEEPSGATSLSYDSRSGVLRLYDLTADAPTLLREITIPANDLFDVLDWNIDANIALALIQYPGQIIDEPGCGLFSLDITGPATATLVIDLDNGVAYQIDETDESRDPSWYYARLIRTRTSK